MSGRRGPAPVAMATVSAPSATTSSAVARWPAVDVDAEVGQSPLLPVAGTPRTPRAAAPGRRSAAARRARRRPPRGPRPARSRGRARRAPCPPGRRRRRAAGGRSTPSATGRRPRGWCVGLTAQPKRQALDVAAADALVAADAGADVRGAAVPGLGQQVAVGDVRPGHADDVGLAGREDALGDVGVGDPAGVDDRQAERLLELAGQRAELHRARSRSAGCSWGCPTGCRRRRARSRSGRWTRSTAPARRRRRRRTPRASPRGC